VLYFINGITEDVKNELEELGAIIQDDHEVLEKKQFVPQFVSNTNIINLDVATLIHLTSDITNGGWVVEFDDPMLREYAEEERASPSLPKLLQFMEGKEIVCTEIAKSKFIEILDILAGEKRKRKRISIIKPN